MKRVAFRSREEAGRLLAGRLSGKGYLQPVVLAISPGGTVVGSEVANALGGMLGLLHAPTPGCTCGCARIAIEGRTAIVVDDGIALGSSLFSWLDELRRRRPKRIVAAAPVGAQSVLVELAPRVDGVVCLLRPRDFRSSGSFYQDFPDVSRAEVLALLGHGGPPS